MSKKKSNKQILEGDRQTIKLLVENEQQHPLWNEFKAYIGKHGVCLTDLDWHDWWLCFEAGAQAGTQATMKSMLSKPAVPEFSEIRNSIQDLIKQMEDLKKQKKGKVKN